MRFEFQGKEYFAKYIFSSKYSDFWMCDELILKIRKKHCDVFGDTTLEQAEFQTNNEYLRGHIFEPTIYLEVLQCLKSDINIGLLMRYIDNTCRLDSFFRNCPDNLWESILIKIQTLIVSSPTIHEYDYAEMLQMGNSRLLNNVASKVDSDWFVFAWNHVICKTNSYKHLLNERVLLKFVKELHGDLSFTNIYFQNEQLYFLDPCVASTDMYYLDSLYQIADFMSEMVRYELITQYIHLVKIISKSVSFDQTLFQYYLLRHCLIRATINYLADDNDYLKYKNAWVKFYDDSII